MTSGALAVADKSNRTYSTYPKHEGLANMSLDAELLKHAERGGSGFRVYGWAGPWVSMGMWQKPERDLLDPELVPWVMRPTGGKGVLHGHDVTVGMAVPLAVIAKVEDRRSKVEGRAVLGFGFWILDSREDRRSRVEGRPAEETERLSWSVRAVYRWMTALIIEALRECGLPAVLAENRSGTGGTGRTHWTGLTAGTGPFDSLGIQNPKLVPSVAEGSKIQDPESPDCFGQVSPNDIVHEKLGLKVCGCALRVTRKAALLQASIPAGPPLIDPRRVFERPSLIVAPPWDSESFAQAFERSMRGRLERLRRWDR